MKFALALAFLTVFSAHASTVKITSFVYPRSGQYYAELCGQVEQAKSASTLIKVIVDPKSKNPGTYNTLAGSDGKFCLTVITYKGEAEATAGEETVSGTVTR
jgi:hypothetical protein